MKASDDDAIDLFSNAAPGLCGRFEWDTATIGGLEKNRNKAVPLGEQQQRRIIRVNYLFEEERLLLVSLDPPAPTRNNI
jgi:hypothetical protein